MANEVNFTSSQRNIILELRDIQKLTDETNDRISSGKEVDSILDDAAAYFLSESLYGRAELFSSKKDGIDQGLSAVTATLDAVEAIDELLDTMKGIAESINSQTTTEKIASTTSFNEIGDQISNLVEDAIYNGVNLLNSTANSLDISFSNRVESSITVNGVDINANTESLGAIFSSVAFDANLDFLGVSVLGANIQGFSAASTSDITTITASLDNTIANLQALANNLGSQVSLLEARVDFTDDYIETLNGGADKLTLADLNEEGAKLTALQTRQELSIQALAISGDLQKNALQLLTE